MEVVFPVRFETRRNSYLGRKLFWSVSLPAVEVYCRHCEGRHSPLALHCVRIINDDLVTKAKKNIVLVWRHNDFIEAWRVLTVVDYEKDFWKFVCHWHQKQYPERITSEYFKGTSDRECFLSHKDGAHARPTFFFTSLWFVNFASLWNFLLVALNIFLPNNLFYVY